MRIECLHWKDGNLEEYDLALTDVAGLVGCPSTKRKVADSVLGGAHAWVAAGSLGGAHRRGIQSINVSLPLFLPSFPSLKKIKSFWKGIWLKCV